MKDGDLTYVYVALFLNYVGLVKHGKSWNVRGHVLTIYRGDRDLAKQGDQLVVSIKLVH